MVYVVTGTMFGGVVVNTTPAVVAAHNAAIGAAMGAAAPWIVASVGLYALYDDACCQPSHQSYSRWAAEGLVNVGRGVVANMPCRASTFHKTQEALKREKERADQESKRADQANERADRERERADREGVRADQAEDQFASEKTKNNRLEKDKKERQGHGDKLKAQLRFSVFNHKQSRALRETGSAEPERKDSDRRSRFLGQEALGGASAPIAK